jgi:hypothetical protein
MDFPCAIQACAAGPPALIMGPAPSAPESGKPGQWTPPHLPAAGDEALVWLVLGAVRPMLFRGKQGAMIRLQVQVPRFGTHGPVRDGDYPGQLRPGATACGKLGAGNQRHREWRCDAAETAPCLV